MVVSAGGYAYFYLESSLDAFDRCWNVTAVRHK
jgi:hypothetical protein